MPPKMSRAQRLDVCHGALGALLLPLISQDPRNAHACALHKKITALNGPSFASKADVATSLRLLVANRLATMVKEKPEQSDSRVFFFPTFMAGLVLGASHPTSWTELDLLLDRRPPKAAAA